MPEPSPTTRTPEVIREEIDATRDDLTDTLDEVFNRRLDLRTQIARHPIAAIAVAAGLGAVAGLWLGGRLGRRSAVLSLAATERLRALESS